MAIKPNQEKDYIYIPEAQHTGIGKALMKAAEKIARSEFQAEQMIVLSGVGVRQYYRAEFGYQSQADYMVKRL